MWLRSELRNDTYSIATVAGGGGGGHCSGQCRQAYKMARPNVAEDEAGQQELGEVAGTGWLQNRGWRARRHDQRHSERQQPVQQGPLLGSFQGGKGKDRLQKVGSGRASHKGTYCMAKLTCHAQKRQIFTAER